MSKYFKYTPFQGEYTVLRFQDNGSTECTTKQFDTNCLVVAGTDEQIQMLVNKQPTEIDFIEIQFEEFFALASKSKQAVFERTSLEKELEKDMAVITQNASTIEILSWPAQTELANKCISSDGADAEALELATKITMASEAYQVAPLVKPKFFIMENVKGMMKKSNEILDNFDSILGTEYSIEITLLNAKDFGIPQNRERVFVIGSRLKNIDAHDIVSDISSLKNEFKAVALKDALFGLPKLESKRQKNSRGVENDKIVYKFSKIEIKTNDFIQKINNNKKIKYLSNHTNRFNNDRDIDIFGRLPQGENSLHESIKDIMPYSSRNDMFKDKYFKLNESLVSKTITSHMKMDCNMYIHPTQPRGLSPREAARVQTFPDDFVFMGANNTWYAQIGNAVPVKLSQIIGSQIMKHLN